MISPRERLAGALALVPNVYEMALRAGISSRIMANAVTARPVATIPYLRIAAAIGFDPLPELPYAKPAVPSDFDAVFFAMGFSIARELKGHSTRQAGKAIDVSASTICRMEAGQAMHIGVVLRSCIYIEKNPFLYCHNSLVAQVSRETRATEAA